jgi:hypothetical protein
VRTFAKKNTKIVLTTVFKLEYTVAVGLTALSQGVSSWKAFERVTNDQKTGVD